MLTVSHVSGPAAKRYIQLHLQLLRTHLKTFKNTLQKVSGKT
jgi:hypothetical protein